MRRAIVITGALAALALPAGASGREAPHVLVGMGEQSPELFQDWRFHATGMRNARLIVPYDVVKAGGWPLDVADLWLARARRGGVEPLVSFGHSWAKKRQLRLPSVREYAARVSEFRARYPWVREFSTWNEANLASSQPTGHHPRRTAVFYRALKKRCEGCTVVAVELLLTNGWRTWRWIRAFRERAGPGPHIWGIHNYPDVTRLRSVVTRSFLRRVRKGEVWVTETGGIVRHNRWRYDELRAARAVRHVFRITSALPRVSRLYLYNWQFDGNKRWDSGLISHEGVERRAYFEMLDALALDRFRPLGPGPLVAPAPAPVPAPPEPSPQASPNPDD
jgi:hypothetical protein